MSVITVIVLWEAYAFGPDQAEILYQRRLAEAGLAPDNFRTLDDLEHLPLTDKTEYIADPQAFRLDPDALPDDFTLEERVIWDIAYTSGTTAGWPTTMGPTGPSCPGPASTTPKP